MKLLIELIFLTNFNLNSLILTFKMDNLKGYVKNIKSK